MDTISYIVVYMSVWWIIFYILQPIGNRAEVKPIRGNADSAPANPRIGGKFVWTTILAFVASYVLIKIIESGYLRFLIGDT
jgi:predicted secreted protein